MRPRSASLAAVAVAAVLWLACALLAPGAALADPPPGGGETAATQTQQMALWEQLGGVSRLCSDRGLGDPGAVARANCAGSGGISSPHPTDAYGLDTNVEISVTDPGAWISSVVQWLTATCWLGLVYLVRGALMLLEWAFTTNLYQASEQETDGILARMYAVIGAPWMTFALAVAGLWGLWNGLVRRRAIETLGGLSAAVLLMMVALVIIARPQDTVGHLSRLVNQATVSVLSVGAAGSVEQPAENLADANRALFDAIVLRPWCALQFGDIAYCTGGRSGSTVADVWLAFPPDSEPRRALFRRTKDGGSADDTLLESLGANGWAQIDRFNPFGGEDYGSWVARRKAAAAIAPEVVKRSPAHVELQEASGSDRRFAMLTIVAIGIAGAVALIGSLAIRMLIEGGLMLLVLLLLAPLALLAPAFGEKGRQAFLTWGKRLLGALMAQFVFAVLLTIVILVTNIVAGLEGALGGWLPCWLVQGAFWWTMFVRRNELLAPLGMEGGRGGAGGLAQLHHALQLGRIAQRAGVGAVALPFRSARAVGRPLRRNAHAWRAGEENLVRQHAQEWAGRRANAAAAATHARRYAAARQLLDRTAADRARRAEVARRLRGIDGQLKSGTANGKPLTDAERATLTSTRAELAAEQAAIGKRLGAQRVDQARSVLARGPEAPALDERGVQSWVDQRRWDVANRAWDHDANLRAAGIDPNAHRQAMRRAGSDAEQARIVAANRQRAEQQMRLDRAMLPRSGGDRSPMSRTERRARVRWIENERGPKTVARQLQTNARAERRRLRDARRRARVYR